MLQIHSKFSERFPSTISKLNNSNYENSFPSQATTNTPTMRTLILIVRNKFNTRHNVYQRNYPPTVCRPVLQSLQTMTSFYFYFPASYIKLDNFHKNISMRVAHTHSYFLFNYLYDCVRSIHLTFSILTLPCLYFNTKAITIKYIYFFGIYCVCVCSVYV